MSNLASSFNIVQGYNLTNEDETGAPIYYGYTRHGGAFVIMRKSDTGAPAGSFIYEFHCGNNMANYDTDWTNRASLSYARSGDLPKIR